MTEAFVVRSEEGSVTVPPATLGRLVVQAAELVDGVRVRRSRRGLDVDVADGRAAVSLQLAARFGVVLPAAGVDVQEQVGRALEHMCEVRITSVDVTICEIDD